MCGILGTNSGGTLVDDPRVIASIAHRGPDSTASFIDGKMGMRISRLAIINSFVDDQPAHGCSNSITAVMNGEIYNYKKLADDLRARGHALPAEYSDAAVIPHLFEEYGHEFVSKLDGMFAIAIWNSSSEELSIYRDSLGIKPIYYHISENNLVFASEINSLITLMGKAPGISNKSLIEFCEDNLICSPSTIYEGIYSLIPGTFLKINSKGSSTYRWYKSWPSRENTTKNIKQLTDEFEDLLIESISDQISHGACNALLLSGGLDSALIAYIIRKKLNNKVDTFHLGYESEIESKKEETILAKKIARDLDFNFTLVNLNSKTYFEKLDYALDAFAQPFGGVTSTYFISETIAKEHKVCLTGDGADELFGSYRKIQNAASMYYTKGLSQTKKVMAPEKDLLEFLAIPSENHLTFSESSSKAFQLDTEIKYFKQNLNIFDFSLLESQLRLLPDQVLMFSDHLGMTHGLEIRPPYLSQKIIDFSRRLPLETLIDQNGTTKLLLKNLGARYFGQEFVLRKKEGFMLPLREWLPTPHAQEWITKKIFDFDISGNKMLNLNRIEKYILEFYQGKHDNFFRVYRVALLMHYLKNHE